MKRRRKIAIIIICAAAAIAIIGAFAFWLTVRSAARKVMHDYLALHPSCYLLPERFLQGTGALPEDDSADILEKYHEALDDLYSDFSPQKAAVYRELEENVLTRKFYATHAETQIRKINSVKVRSFTEAKAFITVYKNIGYCSETGKNEKIEISCVYEIDMVYEAGTWKIITVFMHP